MRNEFGSTKIVG